MRVFQSIGFFLALFFFLQGADLSAQGKGGGSIISDSTLLPSLTPRSGLAKDSIPNPGDTSLLNPVATKTVKYSKDSLDAKIEYKARDSMVYDIQSELIYLYGEATVNYKDLNIQADYIEFDWKNSIVTAEGVEDSLGRRTGNPIFTENEQSFEAHKMRYNFKTKKGKVYNVSIQEGDGYLRSGEAKVSFADGGPQLDDVIYSKNAIYTTCDHPEPHFGIRSTKQKIIPNKLVVVGPSNLEIANIPTPIWLPFGIFPLKEGRRSGVIFPRDFESSPNLGFGLKNLGYYYGNNEYFDFSITGDLYTRGSWGIHANTNYRTRYKFNGTIYLSYDVRKFDYRALPEFNIQRDFLINWTHNQDAAAHPSHRFTAKLQFGTGSFFSNTQNDAQSVLTNVLTSNITYSKRFPGRKFRFNTGIGHTQNTQTRDISITIPKFNFNVDRITPFKSKKQSSSGKDKFYEKIAFTYSSEFQNKLSTKDTILFNRDSIGTLKDDFRYGIKHTLNPEAPFTILKFINITPSINYSELWYFDVTQKTFNPDAVVKIDTIFDDSGEIIQILEPDTISYGSVSERQVRRFKPFRQFSVGATVSTNLYGTLNLKKGRAIRHVMRPTVRFSFAPDYTADQWGYFDSVRVDSRDTSLYTKYSIYEEGIYGGPGTGGKTAKMTFSIGNIFEAKVKAPRDTTKKVKKIPLLQNLTPSISYDFAKDSLQLSPLSISGNTTIFKTINATFGSTFDPYAAFEGNAYDRFQFQENGRLLRFTSARLNLSTNFDINEFQKLFNRNGNDSDTKESPQKSSSSKRNFIERFRISYDFVVRKSFIDGVDTLLVTQAISVNSMVINLTDKWRLNIGRIGYDFVDQRVTYPDLQIYRDLHCWEMGIDWRPERQVYNFFIRVKPSSLDFINVPYKKTQYDPFGDF